MSEYQYYEFQTVDRRLTEMEMEELRQYSKRARITPTSFVNEYDWGSFKGNPDLWMEKYFDGHLYFANWGTRVLQLAVPARALPAKTVSPYCTTDEVSARQKSGRVILSFCAQDDDGPGEFFELEGILSALLHLRSDLADGDLRCLYIGWLLGVQSGRLDDEDLEPPVPPNLGKLSGVLKDFAEFLRVDDELIAFAGQASPKIATASARRKEMAAWVAALPPDEKDRILVGLMSDGDVHAGPELRARFHRDRTPQQTATIPRRTVAQLRAALE